MKASTRTTTGIVEGRLVIQTQRQVALYNHFISLNSTSSSQSYIVRWNVEPQQKEFCYADLPPGNWNLKDNISLPKSYQKEELDTSHIFYTLHKIKADAPRLPIRWGAQVVAGYIMYMLYLMFGPPAWIMVVEAAISASKGFRDLMGDSIPVYVVSWNLRKFPEGQEVLPWEKWEVTYRLLRKDGSYGECLSEPESQFLYCSVELIWALHGCGQYSNKTHNNNTWKKRNSDGSLGPLYPEYLRSGTHAVIWNEVCKSIRLQETKIFIQNSAALVQPSAVTCSIMLAEIHEHFGYNYIIIPYTPLHSQGLPSLQVSSNSMYNI